MRINSGELIKKMRKDMGMSQENLAEQLHISPRHMARIESGSANMDIWQFMSILELLGQPTEDFWLLYLNTKEYEEYRAYRRIKKLLHDRNFSEVRKILPEFETSLLSKQFFIRQFVAYVKVKIDKEISHEQALEKLYEAVRMSKPDYEENRVAEYRLTYNEVGILVEIAGRLSIMGERDRAITLTKAIIESREESRTSEEDRTTLFPALMTNLSTMLGKAKRYKESIAICNEAIEICREHNRLRLVPVILYNMASCYHLLGEEEQIYKPHLIRAYHCAYAIGDNEAANIIKKDAEDRFDITIA